MCSWPEDPEVVQPPYLGKDVALEGSEQGVVPGGGGQGVAELLQVRDERAEAAVKFSGRLSDFLPVPGAVPPKVP